MRPARITNVEGWKMINLKVQGIDVKDEMFSMLPQEWDKKKNLSDNRIQCSHYNFFYHFSSLSIFQEYIK